jgi:hypothetical protein
MLPTEAQTEPKSLAMVNMSGVLFWHWQEAEGSYAKLYDAGRRLDLHNIHGFLPTKIVAFLMNLHIMPRPVYFTRHGESNFNVHGLIGGDSVLSPNGGSQALLRGPSWPLW